MSEHLTNNQIDGYGRRALSAAELLSASDHLGVCETCRRQVDRAMNGDMAFFALQSDVFGEAAETVSSPAGRAHLTYEQTAEYVDGALAGGELQLVKDHLSNCGQCDMTVNDLLVFRAEVASELNREYQPSMIGVVTENRWRRLVRTIFSVVPGSPALVFSSALAAFLLIAAGVLIWQALQQKEMKPEIAKTIPSPIVTPIVSPTPPIEDAGGMLIAQLNDGGGQVILDREGKLSGTDNLPPAYQQMVKGALTDQRFEKSPLLAGLVRPGSGTIRGGDSQDGKFSPIEPVGKVILTDRPAFRWSRLDGATGYLVEIYDDTFTLVATSPQLSDGSWTPPQSLRRGGIYSWQVKAIKDGQELIAPRPPAPQAKFRILDQAKANELMRARRAYASSHLTLALLYLKAGMLDEAERELRVLQKANPNSEIVSRLLSNLRASRS